MNTHKNKQPKTHPSKNHTKSISDQATEPDIDRVARELDTLARQRLPDRVFRGDLTGYEDEIRQDAILLALNWYLRQLRDPRHRENFPWNPARVIAATLQIQKREYLKALRKDADRHLTIPDVVAVVRDHPVMQRPSDWSASTLQIMMRGAIRIALRAGSISAANAAITLELFDGGITVREMAKRLGVHRSAIYQHLGRVRKQIPDIIDGMEVPLIDSL